ncbi:MAG: glycosyltransferase [Gemmatimonadota bacterium]|nr:glycosyltransferase [Gemmatimonadota bacterium]
MTLAAALLLALPWVLAPVVVLIRARHSRSLDEWPDAAPPPAALVSVVIPARNEARNIERCLRSVLATAHPAVEVIVVDDHSTDGTGGLARAVAQGDARVRVIAPEPLPEGWFGKQWACAAGARAARGEILLFTDADTVHGPDLVARAVNAMRARGAELLTVVGRQEMGSFWERVVQPQLFALLLARYGSTERISRAKDPREAIANGQCIFVTRAAYDASGGHEAVREHVAEDLALAQRFVAQGRAIAVVTGLDQLRTRMYTSLGEIVRGWTKNVVVGGREAAPWGRLGRAVYPLILLSGPLFLLLPPAVLALGAFGALPPWTVAWALPGVLVALTFWAGYYAWEELPPWYALLYPVGLAVLLYIVLLALARGSRVEWKGRAYRAHARR